MQQERTELLQGFLLRAARTTQTLALLSFERLVVVPATDEAAAQKLGRVSKRAVLMGGLGVGSVGIATLASRTSLPLFETPDSPIVLAPKPVLRTAAPSLGREQDANQPITAVRRPLTELERVSTRFGVHELAIVRPGGVVNFHDNNSLRLAVDFMELTVDLTSISRLYARGLNWIQPDRIRRFISIVLYDSGPGFSMATRRELIISIGKVMHRYEALVEGYPPKGDTSFWREMVELDLNRMLLEHLLYPPEVLEDPSMQGEVNVKVAQILNHIHTVYGKEGLLLHFGLMNHVEAANQYYQLFPKS